MPTPEERDRNNLKNKPEKSLANTYLKPVHSVNTYRKSLPPSYKKYVLTTYANLANLAKMKNVPNKLYYKHERQITHDMEKRRKIKTTENGQPTLRMIFTQTIAINLQIQFTTNVNLYTILINSNYLQLLYNSINLLIHNYLYIKFTQLSNLYQKSNYIISTLTYLKTKSKILTCRTKERRKVKTRRQQIMIYESNTRKMKMKTHNANHQIIYKKNRRNVTRRKYLHKNLDLKSIAACFFTKPINFKLILITTSQCTSARKLSKNVTLARKEAGQDRMEINIDIDPLQLKINHIALARSTAKNTQATLRQEQKVNYKGYSKLSRTSGKLMNTRLRFSGLCFQHSALSLRGTPPRPARPASSSIPMPATAPTCWPSTSSLGRHPPPLVVLESNRLIKKLSKAFIYNSRAEKTAVLMLLVQLVGSRPSNHLRPHHPAEPQQGLDPQQPRCRQVHHVHLLQEDNHQCLIAAANLVVCPQFRSP